MSKVRTKSWVMAAAVALVAALLWIFWNVCRRSRRPVTFREFLEKQRERYDITEGSMVPAEVRYMRHLLRSRPDITRVVEIGFNGGLSSAAILSSRPDITVVSFDLGKWDYVPKAKALIDECFPGRHTLVLGDSTKTVPEHAAQHVGAFDLAFVDGGHTAPVPELDIRNILPYIRRGGLLLMDDYCPAYGSEGVIQAYDAAVERGWLRTVDGPMLSGDRGWVLGSK